ncbi:MAG: transposase [Firmicutes bacterium]|nr:transposase [Bacillota bacterium]
MHTSQMCPPRSHLNKVAGRRYYCRSCGYQAHRDGVCGEQGDAWGDSCRHTDHVSPSGFLPGNVRA